MNPEPPSVTDTCIPKFGDEDTRNAQSNTVTDTCVNKFIHTNTRNKGSAICRLCGLLIPAGVPLAIRKMTFPGTNYRQRDITCLACSPSWQKGAPAFYCKTCGRPVYYRQRTNLPRYCCWRCEYAARLVKPITVVCTTCDKVFIPPRADARTCSPACRQKAYRQRKRGFRLESAPFPDTTTETTP